MSTEERAGLAAGLRRCVLAERLLEAVVFAAFEFINGPLLDTRTAWADAC